MKPHTRRRKRLSKLLDIARNMPERAHSFEGVPFDVMYSEVCEWLVAQSKVRRWLYNVARGRGLIVFDRKRKTWKGVDTQ